MDKASIGLVLSGGGFRGIAHAGAIKAFEEYGIYPNYISGTSAGALVGALYAANYTPEEIVAVFDKVKIFEFNRYAVNKPGLVNTDTFKSFLNSYFKENNFEHLHKKLFVTATNLLSGKIKVFDSGVLIDALLASASFPGVFSPVTIEDGFYSDGGILDNFPVGPVQNCEHIYGVYLNPINVMKTTEFKHSYDVVNRALHLRMNAAHEAKFKDCEMVIYPKELTKYNTFNVKNTNDLFEIGYKQTLASLKKKKPSIII
ncbi:patatin-like phospholipase family protein [Aurantibacter crassamenti]|uniref:patatin-like phospholipase family protein n=1 Tax=Aurantibacter crassamenti TaxID=1837375 RepID=UPI0019393C66|nr:patatin-like phospholipase family protein [Aurantibacter crassamenti]MBM1106564.1 patatin-like phospholipase family protein [Aurantibacter crassamenti]